MNHPTARPQEGVVRRLLSERGGSGDPAAPEGQHDEEATDRDQRDPHSDERG
jgi:hypothetical protein